MTPPPHRKSADDLYLVKRQQDVQARGLTRARSESSLPPAQAMQRAIQDPWSARPETILALQSTIGNQAVQRLVTQRSLIQRNGNEEEQINAGPLPEANNLPGPLKIEQGLVNNLPKDVNLDVDDFQVEPMEMGPLAPQLFNSKAVELDDDLQFDPNEYLKSLMESNNKLANDEEEDIPDHISDEDDAIETIGAMGELALKFQMGQGQKEDEELNDDDAMNVDKWQDALAQLKKIQEELLSKDAQSKQPKQEESQVEPNKQGNDLMSDSFGGINAAVSQYQFQYQRSKFTQTILDMNGTYLSPSPEASIASGTGATVSSVSAHPSVSASLNEQESTATSSVAVAAALADLIAYVVDIIQALGDRKQAKAELKYLEDNKDKLDPTEYAAKKAMAERLLQGSQAKGAKGGLGAATTGLSGGSALAGMLGATIPLAVGLAATGGGAAMAAYFVLRLGRKAYRTAAREQRLQKLDLESDDAKDFQKYALKKNKNKKLRAIGGAGVALAGGLAALALVSNPVGWAFGALGAAGALGLGAWKLNNAMQKRGQAAELAAKEKYGDDWDKMSWLEKKWKITKRQFQPKDKWTKHLKDDNNPYTEKDNWSKWLAEKYQQGDKDAERLVAAMVDTKKHADILKDKDSLAGLIKEKLVSSPF